MDKDFDKFEIFVLRSVLSVPEDLRGWIRLGHYEVGIFLQAVYDSVWDVLTIREVHR